MTYIKVFQAVRDHHKIVTLADSLDVEVSHAIGLCVSLWLWAVDNAPDGRLPGSDRTVARGSGWHGDPHELLDQFIAAGLVDIGADHTRTIHDWDEYAGALISARNRNRDRMRAVRNTSAPCALHNKVACVACARSSDVHVQDKSRVEKNRVEKSVSYETHIYASDFETWWSLWPKKGDTKLTAYQSWQKLPPSDKALASDEMPRWIPYWKTIENKMIPNASTWLNQRRWEGTPPPISTEPPKAANGKINFRALADERKQQESTVIEGKWSAR